MKSNEGGFPESESRDVVYDTDSTAFSKEERLKVGYLKKESDSEESTYACAYCSSNFESAPLLKMHTRFSHLPVFVNDYEQDNSYCRIGIEVHTSLEGEKKKIKYPFLCLKCNYECGSRGALKSHFWELHKSAKG